MVTISTPTILLDNEALSLLAAEDRRMLDWVKLAKDTDAVFRASSLILVEATDGTPGRDARVNNAIRMHEVELVPVTPAIARRAAVLRSKLNRRKQRDLTVDAVIAATALELPKPVLVLTGDPEDFSALLDGTHVAVESINNLSVR